MAKLAVGGVRVFKDKTIILSCLEAETIQHALVETLNIRHDYYRDFRLKAVIQALIKERDKVRRLGGNQYGWMPLEELDHFITRLQKS